MILTHRGTPGYSKQDLCEARKDRCVCRGIGGRGGRGAGLGRWQVHRRTDSRTTASESAPCVATHTSSHLCPTTATTTPASPARSAVPARSPSRTRVKAPSCVPPGGRVCAQGAAWPCGSSVRRAWRCSAVHGVCPAPATAPAPSPAQLPTCHCQTLNTEIQCQRMITPVWGPGAPAPAPTCSVPSANGGCSEVSPGASLLCAAAIPDCGVARRCTRSATCAGASSVRV